MRKTVVDKRKSASVFVPFGKSPDNEFNRNAVLPPKDLWKIIVEVVGIK